MKKWQPAMRDGLCAACPKHSTIAGGTVGGDCPYCGAALYLSDTLGAPVKNDPFDFSRLPTYRDPMFDLAPKAKVFVELGTQRGFTAYRAALHLPNATIHCVDPWANYDGKPNYVGDMILCWEIFKELHKDNLASGKVVSHKGFSWDVSEEFHEPVDLLWIDGDHTFIGAFRDLCLWFPKVSVGGVVVGDNYEMHDVRLAVDRFCQVRGIMPTIGRALGKSTKREQFWFTKRSEDDGEEKTPLDL